MNSLRKALVAHPALESLHSTWNMTLNVDAHNVQVGCMLFNKQPDDTEKPIGLWARSLTEAELKIDTTQRAYLAIVREELPLLSNLKSTRFTIHTYQNSLNWFLKLTNNTGGQAGLWSRLWKLKFDVFCIAGVKTFSRWCAILFTGDCRRQRSIWRLPSITRNRCVGLEQRNVCKLNAWSDESVLVEGTVQASLKTPATEEELEIEENKMNIAIQ